MTITDNPYTTRDSLELYRGKEPKIYENNLEEIRKVNELAQKKIEENQQQTWCVIS